MSINCNDNLSDTSEDCLLHITVFFLFGLETVLLLLQFLLFESQGDNLEEFIFFDRFRDIVKCTEADCLSSGFYIRVPGYHDNRTGFTQFFDMSEKINS